MVKLNLGSGNHYLNGYVNVDNNQHAHADVVWDLNNYPYPFADNSCDEILASHVIEHLLDPLIFLQELYRIGNHGAQIIIKCPHFSGNWFHPRHLTAISTKLFDFLDKTNSEHYLDTNFVVQSIKLRWLRNTNLGKRKNPIMKILNTVINFLANINPAITERIWCYWVGGFEELEFVVGVKK